MKTIQQLLELSKNPHYNFTAAERELLNDFLAKEREKSLKKSKKKKSTSSSKSKNVVVRNVVKPIDTFPEEKDY